MGMQRKWITSSICSSFLICNLALADNDVKEIKKFPDVLNVKVVARGANRFDFDVTVSSPYDSMERYADGFRVISKEAEVFAVRKLWHDHANEQPFTRDLYGVDIRSGVQRVMVQAKDQKYGYGGKTVEVTLPGR